MYAGNLMTVYAQDPGKKLETIHFIRLEGGFFMKFKIDKERVYFIRDGMDDYDY